MAGVMFDREFAVFEDVAVASKTRPVWLRVGQLVDGSADRPIRNADIVFDACQIIFVGSGGRTPPAEHLAAGQIVPDAVLTDCTVLPCLIEAHAHLFLDGAPIDGASREAYLKKPAEWLLARARARWPRILECGIGAVRDAGDKHGVGLALAAEASATMGRLDATPWIDSPGAAIHHRGRYGSFMGQPLEEFSSPAACVAARAAEGAARIKLLVSGIINFNVGRVTVPPQLSTDEVSALVRAARDHGRQTFAHASGTEGVENAIAGGVTSVEHGYFITEEQLSRMRDRQIAWVPTMAPVQLQIDRADELGWDQAVVGNLKRIIEGHGRMLCRGQEMGVRVVAGSDAGSCGVPHGVGFLQELSLMERAGMSTLAILRSATGVSAESLAFAEPIGRIAPRCRARLIVTRHNPLVTVRNLRKAKMIVFDGRAIRCRESFDTDGL